MEYFFLDQDYDRQYRAEERIVRILSVFTIVAIFVACLGLFGLTAFATRQRIKEIGVRKVLGASVADILVLLAKEVMILVLVAVLVAMPLAFYAMSHWLESFAYRTDVGLFTFIGAGGLALVIAWLTVGYQSFRAALANPVVSIRNE
jgi:putative ABC transport system permease protein